MRKELTVILTLYLLLFFSPEETQAKVRADSLLLNRIFNYAATVDTTGLTGSSTYAYLRFNLNVTRRNFALLAVPTMYRIAHGGCREYLGENYDKVNFHALNKYDTERKISLSTIPHHKRVMAPMLKYLTPNIYNITIFDGYVLSPFHISNRGFYRYSTILLFDGTAIVVFKAKVDNTQLVNGSVTVDYATGRILSGDFEGEYDMSRFHLSLEMGHQGVKSLLPVRCDLHGQFKFIGNSISAHYKVYYDLPKILDDSIKGREDLKLMEMVRPDTLSAQEQAIYSRHYSVMAANDSVNPRKKSGYQFKAIMWDIIGNHVLNRIRYNIGNRDQGYFRLNPVLNPLYMGYSNRRGFYYKFDLRGGFNFSPNVELSARIKAGYSFKQHQCYVFIPVMLYWNKRRNGYLQIETRTGDRIFSSSVRRDIIDHPLQNDSVKWEQCNLDEFKETSLRVTNHYDISSRFGFKVGFTLRNRHSIDKNSFLLADRPTKYKSVAPSAELEYRPWGWKGPVFTLDYERSFKGMMGANIGFERWELDGQYIHKLARLQALSLRIGSGFYSYKEKDYFLDYWNFRENNIPGGWNDKWSGEFETLNSDWYNSSIYYARANVTYETPLLITSRIPWIGHFIEVERLYLSALSVKRLGPYFELGYGFTTRLFSMGIFASNNKGKFKNVEFKFGFELFRDW